MCLRASFELVRRLGVECFFAAFKRTRIPGTFYRSLTVTAPYVVDSANGAVTVRER